MTERHIETELCYFTYADYEEGNDVENINYPSLIKILTELIDRVEKLEQQLDKQEEYQQEQNEN